MLSIDEYDSYIIVAFSNATLILSIGETVQEVNDSELLTKTTTLAIKQIGDDHLVQVHPHGIRHVTGEKRVHEWRPSDNKTIIKAACSATQVAVALNSGEVLYFELDNIGRLEEHVERIQLNCRATSLSIAPVPQDRIRAKFLCIGCDDDTVKMYSLDPERCLEQIYSQVSMRYWKRLCVGRYWTNKNDFLSSQRPLFQSLCC